MHFHLISLVALVATMLLPMSAAVSSPETCPCGCKCDNTRIACGRTFCGSLSDRFPATTTHLKLQRLSLSALDASAFSDLQQLVYLDLSHNDLETIPQGFFIFTPKLRNLVLRSNRLRALPADIGRLGQLRKLDLSDNDIGSLSSDDMALITRFDSVDLRQIGVSEIPLSSVPVQRKPKIKDLDLSRNSISSLDADRFAGFASLSNLDLSYNNISTVHRSAFTGLSNLKNLNLGGNNLHHIESLTFRPLTSLRTLNLSSSGIFSLGDGAFLDVERLKSLSLQNNRIEKVGGWLFGLNSISSLDLSSNHISDLEEDDDSSWSFASTLERLSLANNNLSYVTKTFRPLWNLKYLNLENNSIYGIDKNAFEGLHRLTSVNLSRNRLDAFVENDEALESPLQSLRTLGLASNGISTLPASFFSKLGRLVTLDLSDNPISTIHADAFKSLHLQQLKLNTALLVCDCHLKWFHQWFNSSNLPLELLSLQCVYPSSLNGSELFGVDDADLVCEISPQPRVLNQTETLTKVLIGEPSEFSCNFSGASPLRIEWHVYRYGRRITTHHTVENVYNLTDADGEGSVEQAYSVLRIQNTTSDDDGEYRCAAKNPFGSSYSQRMKLIVQEGPKITISPSDVNASIGATVGLKCSAQGIPPPIMKWSKDGETFLAVEEKRLHVPPSEDCIYITKVKRADAGVYTCIAQNEIGRAEASANLTVYDIPSDAI